jgi:hypothetical protein
MDLTSKCSCACTVVFYTLLVPPCCVDTTQLHVVSILLACGQVGFPLPLEQATTGLDNHPFVHSFVLVDVFHLLANGS